MVINSADIALSNENKVSTPERSTLISNEKTFHGDILEFITMRFLFLLESFDFYMQAVHFQNIMLNVM